MLGGSQEFSVDEPQVFIYDCMSMNSPCYGIFAGLSEVTFTIPFSCTSQHNTPPSIISLPTPFRHYSEQFTGVFLWSFLSDGLFSRSNYGKMSPSARDHL
jgi:hypothetical protein